MQTFQAGTCQRHGLHFAPDGRRLLVSSYGPVLFDTLGADPPTTLKTPGAPFVAYYKLALAGTALVYRNGADLRVWEYSTGRETVIADAGRDVGDLAVSPDGATVYTARPVQSGHSWHTRVFAFDAATGAARGAWPECDSGVGWLSVSADGRRLAGRASFSAGVWDLTRPDDPAAALSLPIGGMGKWVDGVALSADGRFLAIATSRGLEWWDIDDWKPAEVFRSGKHRRRVSAVACSPTRPLIATGDAGGVVFLWDHSGRVLSRYDWGLTDEVVALCFAPDGLRCAAADAKGKVVVWDVDV